MSDQAPELDGGGGGSFLTRRSVGGAPNWLWLVVGTSTVGVAWFLWRRHKSATSSSSQAPAATAVQNACTDANGNPVDCNSLLAVNSEGQSQYEQITSQLTGLSGQDAAVAASVQQVSGQVSAIPSGPAGPAGPAGATGATGATGAAASNPGPSKPVPNVRGMTFAQAKQTLANAGFNVGGGAVQKNYAPGTVITSQTPGPGSVISFGSAYWGTGAGSPTVDLG